MRVLAAILAAMCVALAGLAVQAVSARADEWVWTKCTDPTWPASAGSGVFGHAAVFGINTSVTCGSGAGTSHMEIYTGPNKVAAGQRAYFQAVAPGGLAIEHFWVPQEPVTYSGYVDDGHGWGGGFYWAGGGAPINDSTLEGGYSSPNGLNSRYVGWQIICGANPCDGTKFNGVIAIGQIGLDVAESQGPWLAAPDGLWQATGWVRGDWIVHFYGDSPSGLCSLAARLNGQPIPGTSSSENGAVWHQCAAPAVSQRIHTWGYGQGSMPLTLSGSDAAGLPVSYAKTIYVDNSQPTVSLSGPTDAPSTAGVQYVSASAGGSPSGIAGLVCSVDGAPGQWYPGASVQVPVMGIGEHSVQCSAANNAVDESGNHGWSSPGTWSLKIGDPTVSGVSFVNVVDGLRCGRVKERVKVPARWVTVHRAHRRVKVKRRAHTKVVRVVRCHPRTKMERVRVWVTVRRHRKEVRVKRTKLERVVLTPHLVASSMRRVGYGRGTTVHGWVGTYTGVALGGQPVSVLSAPDNGFGRFSTIATATTAADGSWSANVPAGPSRLIEAVYGGGATTEASLSGEVHLVVPARVRLLSVSPRKVAWGGTVRLVGRLYGGYLPAGGALVRLRIGSGSAQTTYGVREHVGGNGRFSTKYTFGEGVASIHRSFWFEVASLPTGDYPYAPATSRRLSVRVGGHPHR